MNKSCLVRGVPYEAPEEYAWIYVDRYSVFYDHIGCNDCDLYYSSLGLEGPFGMDREVTEAYSTINGYDTTSCFMQNMSACVPGQRCGQPYVFFESGPGVHRTVQENELLWGSSRLLVAA